MKVAKHVGQRKNNLLSIATRTSQLSGSCKGDSGGPLLQQKGPLKPWIQIGSVQGGLGECGDIDYPGMRNI